MATVEDRREFPVIVYDESKDEGEQEYIVRVSLRRSFPTGETLYEDADGNLYAASFYGTQAHRVVPVGDEDDLPVNVNRDEESEPNANELIPVRGENTDPDEELRDADLSTEERDELLKAEAAKAAEARPDQEDDES